jgi:hypothetical protein
MSTVIENKTTVTPNWKTAKVQEEVLKATSALYTSLEKLLLKVTPEIATEANKILLVNKIYFANLVINTPTELVKAIAEYAVNVLGIDVSVIETNNKASIIFEAGNPVNKLIALSILPANQTQALIETFKNGIADLGAQFGFKTEIQAAQPAFVVTFSK